MSATGDASTVRGGAEADRGEASYALFGVRLRSEHAFVNNVPRVDPRAPEGGDELAFAYVASAPLAAGWERTPHAFASRAMIDEGTSFLYLIHVGDCTVLRFSEVADFFVWPDRILCRVVDPAYAFMVELHLLGFVLAYWLERRGVLALHAAGVVVDGHAIGFLAANAGGKSSLAASLVQGGHALLSDDILAVELRAGAPLARPSYPQMRMWPEAARHFWGTDDLPRVHPRLDKRRVPVGPGGFGAFEAEARPLAVLYVPERVDGGVITFDELPFGEAVLALERYAFLAGMLADSGLQRLRFGALGRVAGRIAVQRIAYPSGLDRLPAVAAAIRADAAAAIDRLAARRAG